MAGAIDCKGMKHLAIVAHHDDDLLFMHVDLRKIIDRGGGLRIVYLTASDSGSVAYANDREHGVQCAYWSAVDAAGFAAVADPFVEQARPPAPPSDSTLRQ